ncbi:MAG: O-antigen ligase family protein [Planctomycetota bacterium]
MGYDVRIGGQAFPLELVIACIVFLGFCLLALRLRTLLFLTIVALFLPSLALGEVVKIARLLRWAFLVAIVAKGLTTNFRLGFLPRPWTTGHRLVLALSVLVLASYSWSISPGWTFRHGTMMIVLWVGVYVMLWNSWDSEERITTVCTILFLVASLLFVTEFLYLLFNFEGVGPGRYAGVFLNPNGLGTAVAFLGPFVYWKLRTTENPGVRALGRFVALVMLVSLFQSGSRSGFLGALVCMGVMFSYAGRARLALVAGVVLVPLLLLLVFSPRLDPTILDDTRLVRAESLSHLSDRLPMWEKGFDYFLRRPLLGHGFGMNRFVEFGRANEELFHSLNRTRGSNYHNTHLMLALDLGLVGVALLWAFIAYVLKRGVEIYRSPRRGPIETAGVAFLAAFLALVGDSFVHGWMFSPGSSPAIVFWLVAACVLRTWSFSAAAETAEAEQREEAPAVELAAT